MDRPLFIAKTPFGPAEGEAWLNYCQWAKIPGLTEVVSLDSSLCPRVIKEIADEDWSHIVNEDFRLDYFYDLDYLLERVAKVARKNILGVYRNPNRHIDIPPAPGDFTFVGYDLIEEQTTISALTNCGGFPDSFSNDELNLFGLISGFDRATKIRQDLKARHPNEPHAQCELYALWRMNL
jgi:hypothetical protein